MRVRVKGRNPKGQSAHRPQRCGHGGKVAAIARSWQRDGQRIHTGPLGQSVIGDQDIREVVILIRLAVIWLVPTMSSEVKRQARVAQPSNPLRQIFVMLLVLKSANSVSQVNKPR